MLTLLLFTAAFWAGGLAGILVALWYLTEHEVDPPAAPGRRYADDFAEHLSGRVYDQEHPNRYAVPAATSRPVGERWEQYRDAS